jgi:glutamyl/glutaminyl-tRNA synthetase
LEANGEVMSLDDLVKRFRPTSIHKSAAVVDFKKMDWLANQHFRIDLKDPEKLEKVPTD